MKNYKKLQNGSDIRGIAIVDRGKAAAGEPVQMPDLTAEAAADIATGFLAWLCGRIGKKPAELKLAIGRDPRITGKTLTDGLMNGFGPYGCRVLDCGLASTPAMFMATVFQDFACDGTIMITASHLPFDRNGFKFFTREGGLNKGDIAEILQFAEICGSEKEEVAKDAEATARLARMEEILGAPVNADGAVHRSGERIFPAEQADIITPYSAHLRQLIIDGCGMGERPLEGMKITVDAGNGAGGFYARQVLRPLGADISSSQFLEPDGMFLNHAPNPEDREAMHSVSMKTLTSQSELGLIFDTDVDRSAAVDSRGREIARNRIIALGSALIAEEFPGSTVVTDSITSRQLTAFLENALGLKHLRFRRGYRNIINKAIELNEAGTECHLAIETSGHAAMKENYFLDDGAYLATRIVIRAAQLKKEGRRIESLLEDLEDPADDREVRIPILEENFGAYGDRVLAELEEFVRSAKGKTLGLSLEEPNYEGVRINFPKGWCLLRKSLHEALLPMNMVADEPGGCDAILAVMAGFLSRYQGLDQSVLK